MELNALQILEQDRNYWEKYAMERVIEVAKLCAERDEARADAEYFKGYADGNGRALNDAHTEIQQLTVALDRISAIRDSIISMQGFNWSEHAYPLVAALDEVGFHGAGHEIAPANLGTLIEQIKASEVEVERLRADLDGVRDKLAELEDDRIRALKRAFALTLDTQTCEEAVTALVSMVRVARAEVERLRVALADIHRTACRGDGHGSVEATRDCVLTGIANLKEQMNDCRCIDEPEVGIFDPRSCPRHAYEEGVKDGQAGRAVQVTVGPPLRFDGHGAFVTDGGGPRSTEVEKCCRGTPGCRSVGEKHWCDPSCKHHECRCEYGNRCVYRKDRVD
jgi:hypothetical protein